MSVRVSRYLLACCLLPWGCAGATETPAGDGDGRPDPTGADGGAEAEATDEGGQGFAPDHGGNSVSCDLYAQDCPEGERCAPVRQSNGDVRPVCVATLGDDAVGEACELLGELFEGADTCAAGGMCWELDPGGARGTCVAHCDASVGASSCPDIHECLDFGTGVPAICIEACHPFLDPCPVAGDRCLPYDQQGWECLHDASGGLAPHGTPCSAVNTCNPGHLCGDAGLSVFTACENAAGCCAQMCDLDDPGASCPRADLGESCLPFIPAGGTAPGYENVGLCGFYGSSP